MKPGPHHYDVHLSGARLSKVEFTALELDASGTVGLACPREEREDVSGVCVSFDTDPPGARNHRTRMTPSYARR